MAAGSDDSGAVLRECFHRALEMHGAAREAYLDEVAAGNAARRSRLVALLRAHEGAGDFLLDPTAGGSTEATVGVRPGDRVGPYRLLEEIGSGGFGIVFRAEQSEPVRRLAAVKVLKPGMDTRQVIARFEAERQALALMEHPHIARVLDAGATAEGRPYFAMEYVEGEPVTDFCDRHHLGVDARLRLFADICHAVQHAHHKGVIHRDLKPSNILVADNDGRPVPKIIDFGIAKATGPSLTEETLVTQAAELIGTPAYLSPEQVQGPAQGVDTRADIYSLGVILHVLLTGTTPLDVRTLTGRSLLELRQTILDHEPPRPSVRLLQADAKGNMQTTHGASAAALSARVAGDLDWIVMKALEKDRSRRYSTAEDLARDVARHLADEPVEARPPSRMYRVCKFVRRNRAWVAGGAVAVAALATGLAVAVTAMLQARKNEAQAVAERQRAREVISLLKGAFESVDPSARGTGYTVRELLDDYSRNMPTGLAADPDAEMEMRQTMARSFRALGEYQRAEPHFRHVLETAVARHGTESAEAGRATRELGSLQAAQGRYAMALETLGKALALLQRNEGAAGADTLATLAEMAEVCTAQGALDDAERLASEVVATSGAATGHDVLPWVLRARAVLAFIRSRRGDPAAGLQDAEAAATQALRDLGPRHEATRITANRLAALSAEQKQNPNRRKTFEVQLQELVLQLGFAHPDTVRQTIAQLQGLIRGGEREEGRRRMREVIRIVHQAGGLAVNDPKATLPKLIDYAAQSRRISDFEVFIGDGVALGRELFDAGESERTWLIRVAGMLHFYQGNLPKAEALLREALTAAFAEGPAGRRAAGEAAAFLQDLLARSHRTREADELLGAAPPLNVSADQWAAVLHHAGCVRLEQLRWHEARLLLESGLALRRRELATHPDTLESLEFLRDHLGARAYVRAGDVAVETVETTTALHGPDDPRTLAARLAALAIRRNIGPPGILAEMQALRADARRLLPAGDALLGRIDSDLAALQSTAASQAAAREKLRRERDAAAPGTADAFRAQERYLAFAAATEPAGAALEDWRRLPREAVAFFSENDRWFAHHSLNLALVEGKLGLRQRSEADMATATELWLRTPQAADADTLRRLNEIALFRHHHDETSLFWQLWDDRQDLADNAVWGRERTHVLLPRASWWSHWSEPETLPAEWMTPDFDDHAWTAAKGWLSRNRQHSGNRARPWPAWAQTSGTVCLRTVFDTDDPRRWQRLKLRLSADDAATVWINGSVAARDRTTPELPLVGMPLVPRRGAVETYLPRVFTVDPALLRSGRNVVAVAVHEVKDGTHDFFFELQLEALAR